MTDAHILSSVVLSFPPDTTDDPQRDTSEFNKLLSKRNFTGEENFQHPFHPETPNALPCLAEYSH